MSRQVRQVVGACLVKALTLFKVLFVWSVMFSLAIPSLLHWWIQDRLERLR